MGHLEWQGVKTHPLHIGGAYQFDGNTPIGRSATGEDIARTILFLCEDNSDMITGSVVDVTGAVDVINRERK